MLRIRCVPLVLVLGALLLSGCGGSTAVSPSSSVSGSTRSSAAGNSTGTSSSSASAGAPLLGEAQSAATGDIPDSQVFLSFYDAGGGYSMEYPEGWTRQGSGRNITFRNNNNLIRIVLTQGSAPTPAGVTAELSRQRAGQPSLTVGPAGALSVAGAPVVKVSYSTESAPNPVTGKRVLLLVDRYVYAHAGKVATVDLATPKGVDNIDAYRKISRSFKWR